MTTGEQPSGKVVLGINIWEHEAGTTTKYAAVPDMTPDMKWESMLALDNFMRQFCPEWNDAMVELDALAQKGWASENKRANGLWQRLRRGE